MRSAFVFVMAVSSYALSVSAMAATLSVQSALTHATVGGGDCHLGCNAIDTGSCELTCDNFTEFVSEFANSGVVLTPISINAVATADVTTLRGRVLATAEAGYDVQFTLSAPTYVYATWNIFYPPAQTNFLPKTPPASGVWVGELAAGTYFLLDELAVEGEQSKSSGLLVRIIPDFNADCDADGTPDWQELVNGSQLDVNNDGVPDDCATDPADLDGNGTVGASDLAILLGQWGGPGTADIDHDGIVGASDLALLLGSWD